MSQIIAHFALDFPLTQSVTGRHGGAMMAKEPLVISIADFLRHICKRLDQATTIAKAAEIVA